MAAAISSMRILDRLYHVLALGMCLLLCSCATTVQPPNHEDPTTSVIFMYIDQSDAPSDIRWFKLQWRSGPDKDDVLYYSLGVYEDGVMNHIAVSPGDYTVYSLGGIEAGFLGAETQWVYEFHGEENGQVPYVIEGPGVYFLGSYKLVVEKGGLLKSSTFDLERVGSPSEVEVLQSLVAKMAAGDYANKYPRPFAMAQARLKDLLRTATGYGRRVTGPNGEELSAKGDGL